MVCVLAPLVYATYVSSTLVNGFHHHVHDVVAGGAIGMGCAVLAYGNVFREWGSVPFMTRGRTGDIRWNADDLAPGGGE